MKTPFEQIQPEPSSEGERRSPPEPIKGLDLSRAALFLWRHKVPIVGGAVLAAVLAIALQLFAVEPVYRATATVVVIPARISSELAPSTLSVYGYQTLLESDAVVEGTVQELREQGFLEGTERLSVGGELSSRIFVSKREETRSLAPMLEVVARWDSADGAATVANAWAEKFLASAKNLTVGTTAANIEFVREQYPLAQETLREVEERRRTTADGYQDRVLNLTAQWERRIAVAKRETLDLVAAFQSETRELMEDVVRSAEEAVALASPAVDGTTPDEYLSVLRRLAATRTRLAQTSPILSLEKAITDDSLWQSLMLENVPESAAEGVAGRSLVTEEVNPSYAALALEAVELESQFHRLASRQPALEEVGLTLERLQQDRAAGLAKLRNERSLALAELSRRQRVELTKLGRERDTILRQLARELTQLRGLDAKLADQYNQTVLAGAQESVDEVTLAAAAVPPGSPESRNLPVRALMAAILGGLIGLLVSAFRALAVGP